MISKIIAYSGRNRFFVFLVIAFLSLWGIWSIRHIPLDAIPDLSDTQVIVYTDWPGRSPNLVEDQVTYPISSTLLAAPKVQAVRGFSFLGSSFIYVIFEEGTDIYWARSRVLEYLQSVRSKIPADVNPVLGPDATSLGWGFSYALVDETGEHDLSQLRSLQDWNIKLALESVPGVSQVASVGGFVRQYQITVEPNRLASYGISLMKVMDAVRKSNIDVEGRVLEMSGTEYMVRGRGYITGVKDLQEIGVGLGPGGTPIFLRDVANVEVGPEIRRGLTDLDGRGEVASGIVVVRFGENVLDVIDRVKEKISRDIVPSLPAGVKLVTTYDRSDLIRRSIRTLTEEIIKLTIAVSAVCIIFLFHLPSALVVILTLPIAILISFICMYYLGVTSNIMSLGGIAIAIGAMVDASIIMVENAHKKLEEWEHAGRPGSRVDVIIHAAQEVGPSLYFSLLVITVGFLPVFTLQAQAGRMFKPLAYTKTFAMLFASFLAVTLTPVLMTLFLRGKMKSEDENPIIKAVNKVYIPRVAFSLRHSKPVIWAAFAIVVVTGVIFVPPLFDVNIIPGMRLGTEFMPPLDEGTLFYMPITAPALAISESSRLLQIQDKLLRTVPEVSQVFGKAGRAETPTDPAPVEMFETIVSLKPESEWRKGMDLDKIKNELNDAVQIPGVSNSFTMPIKARIDMLATGIRTPVGVKVLGPKLEVLDTVSREVEAAVKSVRGTRSAYAERLMTGYFLDIRPKRSEIARYGLSMDDVQTVVASALGGMTLTTTVEGRERYSVNVRYPREYRSDIDRIKRILVPVEQVAASASGGMGASSSAGGGISYVPLGSLADISIVQGPTQIKSEEGLLANYVYIDFTGRDVGGYVEDLQKKVAATVKLPAGYRLQWSGEYEYLVKTHQRLKLVIPLTLMIIFVLLYLNTRSWVKTVIVLLAVPFSLVGSFWFLWALGYNMSIAVWVGLIALAGLDAETGVVMLLYLDLAHNKWKQEGRLNTVQDLKDAIMEGAVKRVRPKLMTVAVILAGLVPIMFSHGAGADVMKRIAAPMVGGVITSEILELTIYPAIYLLWKKRELGEADTMTG
jgi:Cu(I)/Ag(I) efflux system membrane protein CusA/SilA